MIVNPIIPIWLMVIICIVLLIFKRKGAFNYIRQIIIVLLLFAINLRVMVANPEATTVTQDVDILFVVDNTISMIAEDYGPENDIRLNGVRTDCDYIMEQFPGASYSVVSFANETKTLLPYTIDTVTIANSLKTLKGQATLYAMGTGFEDVLSSLEDILDRDNEHFQVVFFISDGEITTEEGLGSYPNLKEYIDGGAVLGYGTEEGGKMHAPAFAGDEELEELYYYDDNFERQPALSQIDENNLKSIAEDMGVGYVHMTSTSQIDTTIAEIQRQIEAAGTGETESTTNSYSDTFFFLLIPLIPLLAVDFIYYKRKVNF